MRPNRLNYTAVVTVLTAVATAAVLLPTGAWLGVPAALSYLLGLGWMVGRTWFSREGWRGRLGLGTLAVTAALAFQGAIIYRLLNLGPAWTAALTVIIGVETAVAIAWRLRRPSLARLTERLEGLLSATGHGSLTARRTKFTLTPEDWRGAAALGLALIAAGLLIAYFLRLDAWATDLAVRSPWDLLPDRFLAIVALATVALVMAALSGRTGAWLLLPLAALAVMFTGLAARLYAVGYGFDPFIHQATEAAILKDGLIMPKPPYYLGQYALVTWLARATDLNLRLLDLILVPLAFTTAVLAAARALRPFAAAHRSAAAGVLVVFLLPLAGFTTTTPQGLADALFLATACLSYAALTNRLPLWTIWLTAGAAAAVHPLTGVLALTLTAAVTLTRLHDDPRRRRLAAAMTVAAALALPVLFATSGLLSGRGTGLTLAPWQDPASLWSSLFPALPPVRLFDGLDFAYAWRAARSPLLLALATVGFIACRRRHERVWPFVAVSAVAAADYVLLKAFFSFDFLAVNERANYADRLWPVALFALAPLAAAGLGYLATRVRRAGLLPTAALAVLLTAAVISNLYLTYPRRDRHESSRGWSTAAADVEAVRLIEKDAAGAPYVVLANQATSAAALRELGFSGRYLTPASLALGTDIYLYPIPTGEPLYQRFLALNEARGARTEAEATMRAVGVRRLYYVVDFYWNGAGAIVPAAKRAADQNWSLKNRAFVFRYDLP